MPHPQFVGGVTRLLAGGVFARDNGGVYREDPPPASLRHLVKCTWTARGGSGMILPDGCLDLIVSGSDAFIAGPDTHVWRSTLPGRELVHGVRFMPGAAPAVLGIPAAELTDQRPSLAQVWGAAGRIATDRLLADPGALLDMVAENCAADPDSAVARLIEGLHQGARRPAEASNGIPIGARQLRRRFTQAVGYGPAHYLRVVRLQRAIAAADSQPNLATLAYHCGYSDQAHLSRDFRELAGSPPSGVLASR